MSDGFNLIGAYVRMNGDDEHWRIIRLLDTPDGQRPLCVNMTTGAMMDIGWQYLALVNISAVESMGVNADDSTITGLTVDSGSMADNATPTSPGPAVPSVDTSTGEAGNTAPGPSRNELLELLIDLTDAWAYSTPEQFDEVFKHQMSELIEKHPSAYASIVESLRFYMDKEA
jgi:hypothetical protein